MTVFVAYVVPKVSTAVLGTVNAASGALSQGTVLVIVTQEVPIYYIHYSTMVKYHSTVPQYRELVPTPICWIVKRTRSRIT